MIESAKTGGCRGLRERKREATRQAITAAARLLTAAQGLNGFTVEQLCAEVGISRRTFFNYFPGKEDAILGNFLDDFPAAARDTFLTGAGKNDGGTRRPGQLSPTLMQALFELTCAVAEQTMLTREHAKDLIAAMRVEPQLMLKLMGSAEAREAEFTALIARREQLRPDDPLAQATAALFGSIARRAAGTFFAEDNTDTYPELLARYLNMARAIFADSTPVIPVFPTTPSSQGPR